MTDKLLNSTINLVKDELLNGLYKHGEFNSSHELYAVMKEELDKFWDSVKADQTNPDISKLISLAAVAIEGSMELCQKRAVYLKRVEHDNRSKVQ